MKIDFVAFAKLAGDAMAVEDPVQVGKDGLAFYEAEQAFVGGTLATYTPAQVEEFLLAATRTLQVACQIMKTHPADVMATWKDALT